MAGPGNHLKPVETMNSCRPWGILSENVSLFLPGGRGSWEQRKKEMD